MRPQLSTGEASGSGRKRETKDDLEPMFLQMEQHMSPLKQMIANFTEPSGETMQSIAFQEFTSFNLIITTPLAVIIPHVVPHSQSKPTIPKPK